MLCFVDLELRTARLRNPKRRTVHMQRQMVQMSLLEVSPPAGATPAWAAFDEQQRAEVVKALARPIAKVAGNQNAAPTTDNRDEDNTDE